MQLDDAPAAVAVVLAGGASRRFGDRDKTLATLDGDPLLAHVLAGVAPAVDAAVVACRQSHPPKLRPIARGAPLPVALCPDPEPDAGPAAGLASATAVVDAPLVAVTAADMPNVSADLLSVGFDRIRDAGCEAVVPQVDGYPQLTHAVGRTRPLERAARRSVADGAGSLRATFDALDTAEMTDTNVLAVADRETFVDVDTPDALAALRESE